MKRMRGFIIIKHKQEVNGKGWCALFYLIETNEGSGMRVQLK